MRWIFLRFLPFCLGVSASKQIGQCALRAICSWTSLAFICAVEEFCLANVVCVALEYVAEMVFGAGSERRDFESGRSIAEMVFEVLGGNGEAFWLVASK